MFRSGTVSKEEVMAVCNKMNVAVSEEDLKDIMSKLVLVHTYMYIWIASYMYISRLSHVFHKINWEVTLKTWDGHSQITWAIFGYDSSTRTLKFIIKL